MPFTGGHSPRPNSSPADEDEDEILYKRPMSQFIRNEICKASSGSRSDIAVRNRLALSRWRPALRIFGCRRYRFSGCWRYSVSSNLLRHSAVVTNFGSTMFTVTQIRGMNSSEFWLNFPFSLYSRIHKIGASSSVSCYKLEIDSTSLLARLTHELNTNSDMVTQIRRRKELQWRFIITTQV